MPTQNNVPEHLVLTEPFAFSLAVALAFYSKFPPELREQGRFPAHLLQSALESKQLSREGVLSAAYHGVTVIPSSLRKFRMQSSRAANAYPDALPDKSKSDKRAQQGWLASLYGLHRGEMERLYEALDQRASDYGFQSFEAVSSSKSILDNAGPSPPEERRSNRGVYSLGPRYLWDFASLARKLQPQNIIFAARHGWLHILDATNEVVVGYAVQPIALRFGDGEPAYSINPDWCFEEGIDEHCLYGIPQFVKSALRDLAEAHFGNRSFEVIDPPTIGYVKFLAGIGQRS